MDKREVISYLQRPFQDREWLKKIGIGWLIGFVPLLNLSLLGYLLEWIKIILKEPEASEYAPLPAWKNMGKLVAQGLTISLIIFVYCLIPLALLGAGRLLGNIGGVYVIPGHLFKFLAGLGFGIVSFITPVILIQFATTEKIESAYHIKEIGEKISDVFSEYIISYLLSLGLIFSTWIIIAILSPVIIGHILIPVLNFYIGLVILYRFSRILARGEIREVRKVEGE